MNTYRVDRANTRYAVPVGMNSILYIGDSWYEAMKAFHAAEPGFNAWNEPSITHGVVLSKWSDNVQDYVVVNTKGF